MRGIAHTAPVDYIIARYASIRSDLHRQAYSCLLCATGALREMRDGEKQQQQMYPQEVAPEDSDLALAIQDYVCNVHVTCPGFVRRRIFIVQQKLNENGIENVLAPCTSGTFFSCWLAKNLTAWNRILHAAGVQLREYLPGEMSLTSVQIEHEPLPCSDRLFDGSFLIYLLLKQHQCIKVVHLQQSALHYSCASALKLALLSSTGIKSLELRLTPSYEHHGIQIAEGLRTMPSLESLHLEHIPLCSKSVSILADALSTAAALNTLVLKWNKLSTKSIAIVFKALKTTTSLTTLEVDGKALTRRKVEPIVKFLLVNRTVREVSLGGLVWAVEGIARSLMVNPVIEQLQFVNCNAGDARALAEVLKENSSVRRLKLDRCDVTAKGLKALAEMLRKNRTLEELVVLGHEGRGLRELADALETNTTLKRLDVSTKRNDRKEMSYFVSCLRTNSTLEVVRLSNVPSFMGSWIEGESVLGALADADAFERVRLNWDATGIVALSKIVQTSDTLTELCLADAETCHPMFVARLFKSLASNETVTRLVIGDNVGLRGEPASVLAKVFEQNATLKHVELFGSSEDRDTTTLMEGLAKNRSVSYLKTSLHWTEKDSVKALGRALSQNTTLNVLILEHFCLQSDIAQFFLQSLADNATVSEIEITWNPATEIQDLFPIAEIARRNQCLLNSAISFVLGKRVDEFAAGACRTLCHCDSIRWQLGKVAALPGAEICKLLNAAKHRATLLSTDVGHFM